MLRVRRVDSPGWRDRVYELRYRAYRHVGAVAANVEQRFDDAFDQQPNHVLWALTLGEELVGSIRSTIYTPAEGWLIPEQVGYAEDIAAQVPAKARLCSGNRFVVEPALEHRYSDYAQILLKYNLLAARHWRCDWALAAVRAHHLAFYRRVLRLQQISEERLYPGLSAAMFLTACRFSAEIEHVDRTRPGMRPTEEDWQLVDPSFRSRWEQGLPVATPVPEVSRAG